MLRQSLIQIRKWYYKDFKKLAIVSSGLIALLSLISILVDTQLPFNGWANVVRALLLIPLTGTIFALGYAISIFMHNSKKNSGEGWVPYRLRFSPTWRKRIAAIAGAIIFVFIYGTGFHAGYTILNSCFVAMIIALLAFIRLTREEIIREELAIPDMRDVKYEHKRDTLKLAREEEEAEKKAKKKARREKIIPSISKNE